MTENPGIARARRLIGASVESVPTPALVLDLETMQANIAEMARRMAPLPAALRPHAKIHKSPIIGGMQLDAGGSGLTTATVWEATAMIEAGLSGILIANQVVGPQKVAELARLAVLGEVIVLVDDAGNAAAIAQAAQAAGGEVGVLVELDVGLHRSGVRSVADGLSLAELVDGLPGLRLRGPFGYEGHCMLEPDREERIRKAKESAALLLELADELIAKGLSTEIVAAGGLGTWDITGANPRITEIHAGSYVFSDAFHRNLVPGFEPALTVLSTIISRSGTMAVLDCGRKSIGIDRTPPELVGTRGSIRYEHGEYFIHEEHTAIELDPAEAPSVGDTVRLMPGYSPTTVNFYDCYFVVKDDAVDRRLADSGPLWQRNGRWPMRSLDGRVAMVTGGAQGVGAGIAEVLAREGASVAIADVDAEAGARLADALRARSCDAIALPVDVVARADVDAAVAGVLERWGRLDILAANAGIYPQATIEEIDDELLDRIMDINVKGALHAIQACLAPMRRQRYGRIVLTSSITGNLVGARGFANYGASKAAMVGLMRGAALEVVADNITINAVLPGNVRTAGFESLEASYRDQILRAIPMGRLAEPEDVGWALRFLASEEAGYITGQTLVLDGGQVLPEGAP